MSQSKRSSPSKCLKVRQTMFQFLKRKKKNQLEQSLKQFADTSTKVKNQEYYNHSNTKRQYHNHSRAKSSAPYDNITIEDHDTIPLFSIQRNKFNNTTSNITPRKITFLLDQHQQNNTKVSAQKSSRKPLYDMISPLKKSIQKQRYPSKSYIQQRQTISRQRQTISRQSNFKSNRNNHSLSNKKSKGILKSTSLLKDNSQPFTKKKIDTSLQSLKSTVYKIYEAGKKAKQKNNELQINLINFVKELLKQQGTTNLSKQLNQKLGDIKYVIKSIQSSLNIFSQQQQINEIIQQFHKNLSQHINDLTSTNNHNMKYSYDQKIRQIQYNYEIKCNNLQSQKNKLQRQVEKYMKKLNNLEEQYQKKMEKEQERQNNLLNTIENIKEQLNQKVNEYQQKISLLNQQLTEQTTQRKSLQKQLKNNIHNQQKQKITSKKQQEDQLRARQAYLLQQIQKLKQQFTVDIAKLHRLYQAKQLDYQKKIQQVNAQLEKQITQRKCDRQISDRILQQANISRNQSTKLFKKNQQMMKDLYRMNEQLYQHWLALKDIKTLSQRLKIFTHFQRIYMDLAFNPLLFRT